MTSSRMKTKKIEFNVPCDYTVDSWLSVAPPDEIALILDLASRLPRVVEHEKNEINSKLIEARDHGTRQAIRKVLEEATAKADENVRSKYRDLEIDAENLKSEVKRLILARDQDAILIKQKEADIMQKEHEKQLENAKITAYEDHLNQMFEMKINTMRREIVLESANQHQMLQDELMKLRLEKEALQQSVESTSQGARQEEIQKSSEVIRTMTEQHQAACNALQLAKMDADSRLVEMATDKCTLSESVSNMNALHSTEIAQLNAQIIQLQNPMGRGNSGEFDIAQTLRDIGLHVEDTSFGEKKDAGYMDLLVTLDSKSTDNMRLAYEVKNKQTIRKASREKVQKAEKDIDDDIITFQQRAEAGIKKGLFDGAVFVSIRAHTKMGPPVVLTMFEDTTQRALAPVSYLGPEKAKHVVPLTQEQLETHAYMMFAALEQCHTIRSDLCNGLKDGEIESFQKLFDRMGEYINRTFSDLRKQEQLISGLSDNLTKIRYNSIHMFRSIYKLNSHVPWLQRNLETNWMSIFNTAQERSETMNDADIWNKIGKSKSTIENSIGKDAMFKALHNTPSPSSKRAKLE